MSDLFGPRAAVPCYSATMVPEAQVKKLAKAHTKLAERTTGIIWINRNVDEAWLVEVIPSMQDDPKAHEPIHFSPGVTFRYPVTMFVGNLQSLRAALAKRKALARFVADGQIMAGADAKRLVRYAKQLAAERRAA